MDPAIMRAIAARIPKNPQTGKAEMFDIMKFMEENPEELDTILKEVGKQKYTADLSTFNYNALAPSIIHESFWVIQLEPMGFEDEAGNEVDPAHAHNSKGVKPFFIIYCYDEKGSYRITQEVKGLPDSQTILQAIQRSIAEPLPPLKPRLPWFLLVSIKFTPHVESLKPFLDSLPAPFHWRLETRAEAEGVHDGVADLNEEGFKTSMENAEKAKAAGNKAFSAKNIKAAVKAYTDALGHVLDALSQKPEPADEAKATKLRAICYANRAAAYLIPGAGQNAKLALDDGKAAEYVDPSYTKAYIRQAAASQVLGNADDAQDAIVRGLSRKDLENDAGLVDRLIDLQTGGQGLSDDEGIFKNWLLDILANDKKSAERLKGLEGGWKTRVNAQFKLWPRNASD